MIELLESRRLLSGTTITVDVLSDTTTTGHTTLRDAIAIANADGGDTIQFASGLTGTIVLQQGVLFTTNAVTITGPGANLLTISGNNQSSIFNIGGSLSPHFAVTISGLTLSSARVTDVGGAIGNGQVLTLSDDVFSGNQAIGGGAVYNLAQATLISTNNTYVNNATFPGGVGGAIDNSGILISSHDKFTNNTAAYDTVISAGGLGGAIYSQGPVTITNGTFSDNVGHFGGAAYLDRVGGPTNALSNNLFSNNTAVLGGGLFVYGTSLVTSTNDQYSGNVATAVPSVGGGGGIFNVGILEIVNDTITGNQAQRGGGIYNGNNMGDGDLSITSSTIANNTAVAGGGLYNSSPSPLNIYGSTFAGNSATQAGGGILDTGNILSTNDTFVNNTAGGGGGAVRTAGGIQIVNDTITANQGYQGSGIYGAFVGVNSIVAGNIGSDFSVAPTRGTDNNLLGIPSDKTLADIFQTVPGNPLQPLLANNGGPTQTIALAPGSPAIGVGAPLAVLYQTVTPQSTVFKLASPCTTATSTTNGALSSESTTKSFK